ncbi:zinc-binding dehydrogenase [Chloroflexota bacterium]
MLRGQRRSGLQPGQSVMVIGSGISGLLHVHLAHAARAGRVIATDISEYRLRAAQRLGADATIHAGEDVPARLRAINSGRLADLVIICTGATEAIAQGLRSVERGGTVLFFAAANRGAVIPLSINDLFWRTEITLTSSYAGSPADYAEALELIRKRTVQVGEMITHRLSLSEAGLGFQLVATAQDSIKVVIQPQR